MLGSTEKDQWLSLVLRFIPTFRVGCRSGAEDLLKAGIETCGGIVIAHRSDGERSGRSEAATRDATVTC